MDKTTSSPPFFAELFSERGVLAQALPSYEQRLDQQTMAEEIWAALEEETSALFEAGTGIGKSLAYLIPALLFAKERNERVVISTYTISLQEQLITKDIPFLLEVLGLDLSVVLAKGMGNYVCLKHLEEWEMKSRLFDKDEKHSSLTTWAHQTNDGSKSALPFAISSDVWNEVKADSQTCGYAKCPHYHRCFFFKARAKRQEAHVIVVNHHLLMAHLLAEEGQGGLPPFSRLVVDEAHHLEPVALSSLAQTLDRVDLLQSLARLHSDAHPELSRFHFLHTQLKEVGSPSLLQQLTLDLPMGKHTLATLVSASFDRLDHREVKSGKSRVTLSMLQSKVWQQELSPLFSELQGAMKRWRSALESLGGEIARLNLGEKEKKQLEPALLDVASVTAYLRKKEETLSAFFSEKENNTVRWIETTRTGSILTVAMLDVAPFLQEKLFAPLKTTVLCSATLAVEGDLSHLCKKVGLLPAPQRQGVYPSPFDYKANARLFGIEDISPPGSASFIAEAADLIAEAVQLTEGGAFVLFTSYDMLHKCGDLLERKLRHTAYPLFKQGEGSRHLLLEKYKEAGNGVLLGADSFWEGVDVSGPSLRLVIIAKLPFPVPSDPLLEARAEKLSKEGKDPFLEEAVPQAVVKFKQGFGRLIRSKEDRGCVLCLDSRLFTRPYGKRFLGSLPECIVEFAPKEQVFGQMKRFYTIRDK